MTTKYKHSGGIVGMGQKVIYVFLLDPSFGGKGKHIN